MIDRINTQIVDMITFHQYEKEYSYNFALGTHVLKSFFITKRDNDKNFMIAGGNCKIYNRLCLCPECDEMFDLLNCKVDESLDSAETCCPNCDKGFQCIGYEPFKKLCDVVDGVENVAIIPEDTITLNKQMNNNTDEPLKHIPRKYSIFEIDEMRKLMKLIHEELVTKYDTDGRFAFQYSGDINEEAIERELRTSMLGGVGVEELKEQLDMVRIKQKNKFVKNTHNES